MSIGPVVRSMLGPLERPAAACYRATFVDLAAFVRQVRNWSSASRILELGCGEGAVAEKLACGFPDALITGIDVTPKVGRMFRGDASRVTFRQQGMKSFAAENPRAFDLLVMCDVLHHIPWDAHEEILADAGRALKDGGYLVVKDWERSATPIHTLCYLADRYITGDRVRYKSAHELKALLERVFGLDCIKGTSRIRPWTNNIAFLVQVGTGAPS